MLQFYGLVSKVQQARLYLQLELYQRNITNVTFTVSVNYTPE